MLNASVNNQCSELPLADESVVLVVLVVLGVPGEAEVVVHVHVGQSGGLAVDEVVVIHGGAGDPGHVAVAGLVDAAEEVVGAVPGVDGVEHALEEVLLVGAEHLGQEPAGVLAGRLRVGERLVVAGHDVAVVGVVDPAQAEAALGFRSHTRTSLQHLHNL